MCVKFKKVHEQATLPLLISITTPISPNYSIHTSLPTSALMGTEVGIELVLSSGWRLDSLVHELFELYTHSNHYCPSIYLLVTFFEIRYDMYHTITIIFLQATGCDTDILSS